MGLLQQTAKQDLIDRAVKLVHDRLTGDRAAMAESFLRQYTRDVPPADLEEVDAEQLYGSAVSLLGFARQRAAGTPKIRVYNPRLDEHGWTGDHTVVEVVNDDMPFLVDSVSSALSSHGLNVLVVVHPILHTRRSEDGTLTEILDADAAVTDGVLTESVIHIEISEQGDPKVLKIIADDLETVLRDVRHAVADWPQVNDAVRVLAADITEGTAPAVAGAESAADVSAFLTWLSENHFTMLGYRHYAFTYAADADGGADGGIVVEGSGGLGILRNPDYLVFDELRHMSDLPPEMRAFVSQPTFLLITKSNRTSRVHRPVHMDVIGVKRFDDAGRVTGIDMLVGLFTSNVYTNSASFVPVLRTKIDRIMRRAGFRQSSHDGKRLLSILENLPRDELFQASDDKLMEIAMGILHLQDRARTALFVRQDEFERFVSALVFVPRDRFDTALRLTIRKVLEEAFAGQQIAYSTQVGDSPLARLHCMIKTAPGQIPDWDVKQIEKRIAEAARAWTDHLHDAILQAKGEERGGRLLRRYGMAFPSFYKERYTAQSAVYDIDRIEDALTGSGLSLNLYRPLEASDDQVSFKVYRADQPVTLSEILPMLENMGFLVSGEMPFEVTLDDGKRSVWVHDFSMRSADGSAVSVGQIRTAFHEAFLSIWQGNAENDGFNRLVVTSGLTWREVVMLRAYAKYLRQAAFTFSQQSIETALAAHDDITRHLVRLFHVRFDPAGSDADDETALEQRILEELESVTSSDDDRILRRYLNLIQSTLRTNFYQGAEDGSAKSYVSFKIDSRKVEDLPLPRPMVEVWVYSPRVEAIHLRGGKVARGGIRWSDRREDFRTEILGLIKAQMVKNAVIVPVGSKGGFVVKRPPTTGGREAYLAEGIECYRTLMRGLLDITDNLVAGAVVPPQNVRRRDDDDPYLVVAADKGTATFSDIANAISQDYGFWLDDAFASGGSQGYDHKAMGITAKGAWEAVKRHFREVGHDTQTEDFTCVGVGDMSGDVFGNGMLLSRHIRLVSAFNHMHIFIDPTPDAASSFAERERLFNLPRSTWADYDKGLISAGGGVFERSAKRIPVSAEMKELLGLTVDSIAPNDLISVLLKAQVDLLWFGGIGTYIKASSETNADAGDRANDAVRVNGNQIRAMVVGEGANLGVTQRARIEMAQHGVRLNTDAIDNSAGVDCSDHEVNIKILVNQVLANGDMTLKQRNQLLADMTDEVGALVLRDNYLQTQAISLVQSRGVDLLDHQVRLIRMLERAGRLDRAIEYLPDDEAIAERQAARTGLTRPELAVLIAYSKLWLFDEIIDSDLPDDPSMEADLINYFPTPLREVYAKQITDHKLKREIIATHAANSIVNRAGITFMTQIMEKTGQPPAVIARAYVVCRDAYGLRQLWTDVEALDTKVSAEIQLQMLNEANRLIERNTLWVLRHVPQPIDQGALITSLRDGADALLASVDSLCSPDMAEAMTRRIDELTQAGVPDDLARRVAHMGLLESVPDVVRLSAELGLGIQAAACQYFAVGSRFGLGWLHSAAEALLLSGSHWEKLAAAAVIDELYALQRAVTARILTTQPDASDPDQALALWAEGYRAAVDRTDQLLGELRMASTVDLAMLTVASRQFGSLAG